MSKKLKVYATGVLDGTYSYAAAAPTKAAFAKLIHTTLHALQQQGCCEVASGTQVHTMAMAEPGLVWRHKEDHTRDTLWEPYTVGPLPKKPPIRIAWNVGRSGKTTERGTWTIDWYEWHGMTDTERADELDQYMQDEISNYVDAGYHVLSDTDEGDEE